MTRSYRDRSGAAQRPLLTYPPPVPDGILNTDARVVLFGFEPAAATVALRRRPRRWRVGGALKIMAVAVVVAPVLGLIPPHAPWIIGALAVGGFLAKRRLDERFTVVSLEARCPRCDASLQAPVGRLRDPHPVPCQACHHEPALHVPTDALEDQHQEEP